MNRMKFLAPIWFFAVAAIFAVAVMLLWNWLMPAIFGFVVINYWQALGILVLCRLLFGSFGSWHHMMHGSQRGGMHNRSHIREKWMKMTPEQRKEFVKNRREHFRRGEFFIDEDTPKEQDNHE